MGLARDEAEIYIAVEFQVVLDALLESLDFMPYQHDIIWDLNIEMNPFQLGLYGWEYCERRGMKRD